MPIAKSTMEFKDVKNKKIRVVVTIAILSIIIGTIIFSFQSSKNSSLTYEKARIELDDSTEKISSAFEALENRFNLEDRK